MEIRYRLAEKISKYRHHPHPAAECTVEVVEGVGGNGSSIIGIGEPGISSASPPTPPRHAGPHRAVRQVEVKVLGVVHPAHQIN